MATTEMDIEQQDLQALRRWKEGFLPALEELLHQILLLARRDIESDATYYCYDWDIIQDYVEQDRSKSVYAFAVTFAIRSGSDGREPRKFVILDGTKQEIRSYLAKRIEAVRGARLLSRASRTSREMLHGRYSRLGILAQENWSEIADWLAKLEEGMDGELKARISRLEDLLSENVLTNREVQAQFIALSDHEVRRRSEYKRIKETFADRPGEKRNIADATNVFQCQVAGRENINARLVTGTETLLRNFPETSVDPFTTVVYQFLQDEFGDARQIENSVRRWVERVTHMIQTSDIVIEAVRSQSGRSTIRMNLARTLKRALEFFREDDVLNPLLRHVQNAVVDARNRVPDLQHQTRSLDGFVRRLPIARVRNIENRLSALVDQMSKDGAVMADLGMAWHSVHSGRDGVTEWQLVESGRGEILTFEAADTISSMYWPVDLALEDVFATVEEALNAGWVPRATSISVQTILHNGTLKWQEAEYKRKRWWLRDIERWPAETARVRVLVDSTAVFYETGLTNLRAPPRVAVLDDDTSFRWKRVLFKETSSAYVPDSLLHQDLSAKFSPAE